MIRPPEYPDGYIEVFKIKEIEKDDYPEYMLVDQNMHIWFREISVYDRIKYEFDQGGKEVTMKVRIPRYKNVDAKCVVRIMGEYHKVFNAAHIEDKNGFPETELTLIRPEVQYAQE